MPPGGVHLLAGVGVLRLTHGAVDALAWKRFPLVNTKDRLKALVNGFILGCIAPDGENSFPPLVIFHCWELTKRSSSLLSLSLSLSLFLSIPSRPSSLCPYRVIHEYTREGLGERSQNILSFFGGIANCRKCCHWSSQQVRGTPRHRT